MDNSTVIYILYAVLAFLIINSLLLFILLKKNNNKEYTSLLHQQKKTDNTNNRRAGRRGYAGCDRSGVFRFSGDGKCRCTKHTKAGNCCRLY